MPARVFVSSVMEDFGSYREATRRAIEAAGYDPVLVEDFPSLDASPRTACLDAVQSCDVFVGVLGLRAGSEAPSGRTIVEEEFLEAETRGLPILLFIQEGDAEPRQKEFIDQASEFIKGRYRVSFDDPEELEGEVERALTVLVPGVDEDPDEAHKWVADQLGNGLLPQRYTPSLRVAIAPVRQAEVIDPRESRSVSRRVLEIAHSESIGLFNFETGYETELQESAVRIAPVTHSRAGQAMSVGAVTLHESGRLFVEANITGLRDRNRPAHGLQIVEEDVATQLRRTFAVADDVYHLIDEFRRLQGFVYQAGLFDLGHRTMVGEDRLNESGGGIPMGRTEEVTAHPEPRQVNRRVIAEPGEEIERTMERFRRALEG